MRSPGPLAVTITLFALGCSAPPASVARPEAPPAPAVSPAPAAASAPSPKRVDPAKRPLTDTLLRLLEEQACSDGEPCQERVRSRYVADFDRDGELDAVVALERIPAADDVPPLYVVLMTEWPSYDVEEAVDVLPGSVDVYPLAGGGWVLAVTESGGAWDNECGAGIILVRIDNYAPTEIGRAGVTFADCAERNGWVQVTTNADKQLTGILTTRGDEVTTYVVDKGALVEQSDDDP